MVKLIDSIKKTFGLSPAPEAPHAVLPYQSDIIRGQQIGTEGEVFLVEGEEDKVVKTYQLSPVLVISLGRLADAYAQIGSNNDTVGNILIPSRISYFRQVPRFTSTECVHADMVFTRMDGDMFHFSSDGDHLDSRSQFNPEDLKTFVQESCSSMSLLNKLHLAHGDLKTANFLYQKDPSGKFHFYLTDYGNLVAGPTKRDDPSAQRHYELENIGDRYHYCGVIKTFLRGSLFEYHGEDDYITSVYGQEMLELIETFLQVGHSYNASLNDSIKVEMTYQQFSDRFSAIIDRRFRSEKNSPPTVSG